MMAMVKVKRCIATYDTRYAIGSRDTGRVNGSSWLSPLGIATSGYCHFSYPIDPNPNVKRNSLPPTCSDIALILGVPDIHIGQACNDRGEAMQCKECKEEKQMRVSHSLLPSTSTTTPTPTTTTTAATAAATAAAAAASTSLPSSSCFVRLLGQCWHFVVVWQCVRCSSGTDRW
jgi:hypothetical protein